MKLNIDFETRVITLTDSWDLEELHWKLKEICGNEECNWDKWTIRPDIKVTNVPSSFKEFPIIPPYRVNCDTNNLTIRQSNNIY